MKRYIFFMFISFFFLFLYGCSKVNNPHINIIICYDPYTGSTLEPHIIYPEEYPKSLREELKRKVETKQPVEFWKYTYKAYTIPLQESNLIMLQKYNLNGYPYYIETYFDDHIEIELIEFDNQGKVSDIKKETRSK